MAVKEGLTHDANNPQQSTWLTLSIANAKNLEKVSFRIGGNEVAYVSNRRLYILDAEVTGSITLGDWLLSHGAAGLTIRNIGG